MNKIWKPLSVGLLAVAVIAGAVYLVSNQRGQALPSAASVSSQASSAASSEASAPASDSAASVPAAPASASTAASGEAASSSDSGKTYSIYMQAEYLYGRIPDLYREADLVVYGTYGEDLHSEMDAEASSISTTGTVNVMQTLKGECPSDTLEILFTGGTVSAEEYLENMLQNESRASKHGLLDEAGQQSFLETYDTVALEGSELANPESGKAYVFFLSAVTLDNGWSGYSVMSGADGAREVLADGQIYDPDLQRFVSGEEYTYLTPFAS